MLPFNGMTFKSTIHNSNKIKKQKKQSKKISNWIYNGILYRSVNKKRDRMDIDTTLNINLPIRKEIIDIDMLDRQVPITPTSPKQFNWTVKVPNIVLGNNKPIIPKFIQPIGYKKSQSPDNINYDDSFDHNNLYNQNDEETRIWKKSVKDINNILEKYYPDIEIGNIPHPSDIPERDCTHPEIVINNSLLSVPKLNVIREVSLNGSTPIDFIFSINGNVGIVECDGQDHFPDIMYKRGIVRDLRKINNKVNNDSYKLDLSFTNGIPLLRVNVCYGKGMENKYISNIGEIVHYFVDKVKQGYYNFCMFSHRETYTHHIENINECKNNKRFIFWDQNIDYETIDKKFLFIDKSFE